MQNETIHQKLNRLLAEIGGKRTEAGNGDESAEAWVAGVDYWLSLCKTGDEVAYDPIITRDILPLLRDYHAVLEFEKGYRCAAAINAAPKQQPGSDRQHRMLPECPPQPPMPAHALRKPSGFSVVVGW